MVGVRKVDLIRYKRKVPIAHSKRYMKQPFLIYDPVGFLEAPSQINLSQTIESNVEVQQMEDRKDILGEGMMMNKKAKSIMNKMVKGSGIVKYK